MSIQEVHILDCKRTVLHDRGEVIAPGNLNPCDQPHPEAEVPAAKVDLEAEVPAAEVDLEAEGELWRVF